ncbi:hypothetical protein [Halobacterium sp. CBA1126]|uniref:hypothetical protein n=1 Tax=Halobacterium sp. CBA1126 TaxID=2668074 RepID=UPI0018D254E6|nr:hypothetical protein [Halobacterium sp. CBA1126]
MMDVVMFAQIVAASIVGTVCHETAHALAAVALGKFHAFDVRNWEVHWRYAGGTVSDYAVAAAPLGIGLLALPAAILAFGGLPPLWFWLGWAWFTLVGALSGDFQFAAVEASR